MPEREPTPERAPPLATVASRLGGRRRLPAVLWDAVTEARACRAEALAEAGEIVARAGREAEALRVAAVERGREEGLASVADTYRRALLERDRLLDGAREELIELTLEVAQRVIGDVVRRHPEIVVDLAARALEASRGRVTVTIRASPADVAVLRAAEPRLFDPTVRASRVRFAEDPELARGGVVVDTELGRVDASVEGQLGALRRSFDDGGEGSP